VVEHLTQKQVEDYCRRRLSAAELLVVTDHLGGCDVCRRRIQSAGNGEAAFFELRSEVFEDGAEIVHLTMEQTAALAERSLTGEALQAVEDHLSHCEQCVAAVADLREFRNEIAPSLDREYRPAGVTAPAESARRGLWARLRSLLAGFRVSPAPIGAAALAIVLLAVLGWFFGRQTPETAPQIANAPTPQPTAAPSQSDPLPAQPPAEIVAQVNDGSGVVSIDRKGTLSGADGLPPSYQNLIKKALTTGRIEKSAQLQGLTRPPSSLMGSDSAQHDFSVLEPLGNVLLTDRPTFRWSAMEGATGYVVEVYDEVFTPVTTSPQLTTLTWTTRLPRGHVYSWQVKAIKDAEEITSPRPPAPQAKFRILDQTKANELANARRAHASSHLTLGLLYADAGLLREAEQEFRLLQKANPTSPLARNLLRQIQALRRQQ
jgi:anti-sigma factor RsiW